MRINSPTWGSFVLMVATRAANTGVKGKLAAWAFIMLRANSPRPRIKFSEKSSICLIFAILTRLTIPVMDLHNASHVILDCFCLARQQPALHVNEQGYINTPQTIFATCYRHSDFEIPTLVRDPRRALQFPRWCKHVQSLHTPQKYGRRWSWSARNC